MFKLLLAEDETAAREGILAGVSWEELGIGTVKAAKNGALALKTARDFYPDILLTDIKMPRMDGIELAKAIRKINPNCSVLILSGYAEVDYLKSAISLHVIDFVEKPVQLPLLKERIRNAVDIQNAIQEKLRLQKSKLAASLSHTFFSAEQVVQEVCSLFQLPESETIFCRVRMVRVLTDDDSNIPESDLLYYQQGIENLFSSEKVTVGLCNRFIQITSFAAEIMPQEDKIVLERIQAAFPQNVFFMGTGEMVSIMKYENSFFSAIGAVSLIFYDRSRFLWDFRDLPRKQEAFDPDIGPYRKSLSEGKKDEMKEFTRGFAKQAASLRVPPKEVTNYYIEMFMALSHQNTEKKSAAQMDSAEELLWEYVFLERMESWIEKEIDCCFQSLYSYNSSKTIDSVIQFVRNNYQQKNLSLRTLSKRFYLSEAYLCIKFKEVTKKTFTQYLTELRIEQSLPMLAKKNYKINDIAVQVGFDNGNYYSKIFKKQKGVSPKDFRKRFGIM